MSVSCNESVTLFIICIINTATNLWRIWAFWKFLFLISCGKRAGWAWFFHVWETHFTSPPLSRFRGKHHLLHTSKQQLLTDSQTRPQSHLVVSLQHAVWEMLHSTTSYHKYFHGTFLDVTWCKYHTTHTHTHTQHTPLKSHFKMSECYCSRSHKYQTKTT